VSRQAQKPTLNTFTTRELRGMILEPIVWFVQDLLTVGLWILAGPPKVGKSWLLLNMLISLATGGLVLGSIKVAQKAVLYLALEDNARRLRSRLSHLGLDETGWPDTFHVATQAPKLDMGLVPALESFLDEHPDVRVVVVDTLARVRGKRSKDDDLYTSDSRVTEALQALAMSRGLAIIMVHHVRKAPGTDIFETVSGSYGLTGPADGVMILQRVRGDADATLHVTGRDIEEQELALNFDGHTGTWKLLGDARMHAQSAERRTILEVVAATPGLTPKEIADATGLKHGSVKHLCIRLRDEAKLTSDDHGRYHPSTIHSIHPIEERASQTTQSTVNGTPGPRSPIHPVPVNGVNGRDKDTLDRLHTAHKRGAITDADLMDELTTLFAERPPNLDRLMQIAQQVLA
jgi:hypothetical protein